jgi:TolB-like protein
VLLSPGDQLGPYEICELIGQGGMGAVYRARDSRLGRFVAIKVLAGQFASGAARFWQEARAVSSLNHPNICTIYDVGEHAGASYLVMELLEGSTLKHRIAGNPLPRGQFGPWAIEIASGLETAHQAGIVHRDIKPANIFITTSDIAKILDFGLATSARAVAAAESESTATVLTLPGSTLGTVNYMSPEQARGGSVDHRSDIFSFGAVLYEMATGRMAFPGSMAEAFSAILGGAAPLVGDAKLDAVIGGALQKDPHDRYQSAAEMRRALAQAGQDQSAPVSRRKLIYGAGAAAAAAVTGALVWRPFGAGNRGRTLAVVLIENLTGDASLDWMDRGLSELLTTALAQSNALPVLSTERVRSAAVHRFKGSANLKAEQARDVAAEARADLYASGSLFKPAGGFRLNLRAQETDSGKLIYSGTMEGPDPQALFGMTDRAATAMLAQIAPRAPGKIDSGGGLTTNLEALKAYTEGLTLRPIPAATGHSALSPRRGVGSGVCHGVSVPGGDFRCG